MKGELFPMKIHGRETYYGCGLAKCKEGSDQILPVTSWPAWGESLL